MEIIKSFIEKIRPDRMTYTGSIFPEILADKIASDLGVEKIGQLEGSQNEPSNESTILSVTELKIVGEVKRLRMDGFNRFNDHMETYARRLREASNSRAELLTITKIALGNYEKTVANWKNKLVNANEHVKDRKLERDAFRQEHKLNRTSHDFSNLILFFGILLFLVLLESIVNGYFFATGNELGLFGGISVATTISILNVGFLSVFGYLSRYINHRYFFRKMMGLLLIILALAFTFTFNLGVSHFREATASFPWEEAVFIAVKSFQESPFGIENIESWFLFCAGILVCITAFWKAWAIDDPYPDYGRVSRRLENSRENYAHLLDEAFIELEELRNQAVDELDEARRTLTQNISEAADVVAARAGLAAQLNEFLSHADQVVQQVLAIYRAANRKSRSTPEPKYFQTSYSFDAVNMQPMPSLDTTKSAIKEIKKIDQIVSDTIESITQRYSEAIHSFNSIGLIENEQEVQKA